MPRSPLLRRGKVQKFIFKAVRRDNKQWYTMYTNAKYILDIYINWASLLREYPSMVQRIEALNMNLIFHQPTECNLHLVREFYANWDPSHSEHLLKVRGKAFVVWPAIFSPLDEASSYRYRDSDMESDEEEQSDDDEADDDGDDEDVAAEDMSAIVPFD
ncbi:hypothetical protein T459_12432 [Capsicum annuum]|uniref:Uncharacterized protein n=1 Tax=Capsicum annuum TaxID=4072 RepID=A0A2G2ZPS4_CAPAN|nr:hypothetical protein T459_12432 [Capsicum annuum]